MPKAKGELSEAQRDVLGWMVKGEPVYREGKAWYQAHEELPSRVCDDLLQWRYIRARGGAGGDRWAFDITEAGKAAIEGG